MKDYCEKYLTLVLVGALLQSEKLCDESRTRTVTNLPEVVSDGDRMEACMKQQLLKEYLELEGKMLERKIQTTLFNTSNISFHYHSKQDDILRGISYTVESGGYLAITGSPGSGRTALLKCIVGLLFPMGGEVLCKGKDTARVRQSVFNRLRRTGWGLVLQEHNLMDAINMMDNVHLPACFNHQRLNKDAVITVLEGVNLGFFASRSPNELSGGQQQCVATMRAIASKREVVFTDEPAGALDSKSSKEVVPNLAKLDKTRATVLMVTYGSMVAAAAVKVSLPYDGEMVQQGNYQPAQEISNILLDMENANA